MRILIISKVFRFLCFARSHLKCARLHGAPLRACACFQVMLFPLTAVKTCSASTPARLDIGDHLGVNLNRFIYISDISSLVVLYSN